MSTNFHGPENAEHELKKAYNSVMEAWVVACARNSGNSVNSGVSFDEVRETYERAFNAHRRNDRLAAERWARTAKHLARAFWHEAKIECLEPRTAALPFLKGATAEEYSLHEKSDTTADLLNSLEGHIPRGFSETPAVMRHYLSRARQHLARLVDADYPHELLRAERIKAAHEYGRVLECMALAHEATESRAA